MNDGRQIFFSYNIPFFPCVLKYQWVINIIYFTTFRYPTVSHLCLIEERFSTNVGLFFPNFNYWKGKHCVFTFFAGSASNRVVFFFSGKKTNYGAPITNTTPAASTWLDCVLVCYFNISVRSNFGYYRQ